MWPLCVYKLNKIHVALSQDLDPDELYIRGAIRAVEKNEISVPLLAFEIESVILTVSVCYVLELVF